MALSSAKALGFLPGARKAPGMTVCTGAMRWVERKLGAAYIIEVTTPRVSTNTLSSAVSLVPSWSMPTMVPSAAAAIFTVWRVAGRAPKAVKCWDLAMVSFTGLPVILAATAAAIECGSTKPFEPKPPPT